MMTRVCAAGNSLMEYAVPLIFIVSVISTTLTAVDFPRIVSDLFRNAVKGDYEKDSVQVKSFGELPNGSRAPTDLTGNRYPGSIILTMGHGKELVLEGYPHDLEAALKKQGGAAVMGALMAELNKIANTLEAEQQINHCQAVLMRKLAHKGNIISNLAGQLKSGAIASGDDRAKWQNKRWSAMDSPKQILTTRQAVDLIKPGTQPHNFSNMIDAGPARGHGRLIEEYYRTYEELEESGALDDPAVAQIVRHYSDVMLTVSHNMHDQLHRVVDNNDTIQHMSQRGFEIPDHLTDGGICYAQGPMAQDRIRCKAPKVTTNGG